MHKQIYVNLPVKDLAKSKAFFEAGLQNLRQIAEANS